MSVKKAKYYKFLLLVLLPVFFMYLQHSAISYHTHIFADGKSVTHKHCFQECQKNNSENSKEDSKNQLVIYHGFVLQLGDNVPNFEFAEYRPSYFTFLTSPVLSGYDSGFFRKKTGRAPPAFLM